MPTSATMLETLFLLWTPNIHSRTSFVCRHLEMPMPCVPLGCSPSALSFYYGRYLLSSLYPYAKQEERCVGNHLVIFRTSMVCLLPDNRISYVTLRQDAAVQCSYLRSDIFPIAFNVLLLLQVLLDSYSSNCSFVTLLILARI